jgi:beta-lactamase regulating signal transducer with metallopeptidase domain
MSGPGELAVLTGVVLDAGLKATPVLAATAAVARWTPGTSAAQRHAVWAVGLGALPLLAVGAASRGPAVAVDQPWLGGLWAVGALAVFVRLGLGLWRLRRLGRRGVSSPDHPGVVFVDGLDGPVTWGMWRPVVALPPDARSWSTEDRDAAVAHERAHVARHDWAVDLVSRGVAALFWFHPLVWVARRSLADEAEGAADDRVLAAGVRPSTYAALLLRLATQRPATLALGVGSRVGRRVRAVLRPRVDTRRRPVLLTALAALTLVGLPALAVWPTWTAPPEALTCDPGPLP